MSALSGFFGERPIDLAAYYEGHSLLWRRGPHDEGFFVGPTLKSDEPTLARGNRTSDVFQNHPHILELKKSLFCLGQHHLKTIDPTAGDHQPLQTREGRYTLIFDGEIYNFNDLRLELMNLGHVFATASDTEVFLAAYSEWGENSFNKCNGQWAAVIYDSQEKTFVFSRDRLGEKPLYYSKVDSQIFFASEFKFFKSLNKAGVLPLTLNKKAASVYLKYGYLNFDHTTFYNEINAVKPGHCYLFSSQGKLLSAKKFWSLDLKYKSGLSFDVAKDHLKDLLISAVEIREVESKAPFKMSNRELDPLPSAVEDQILKISEIAEQPLSALAVCCAVQLSNRGKSGSLLLDEGKNWHWAGHPSHFSLHMKDQLKKGNLKPLIQNMALKISQGQKAFEAVSQRWMALNTSRKESRDSLFFQAPEEPHFFTPKFGPWDFQRHHIFSPARKSIFS
jgi:hypothetical protein